MARRGEEEEVARLYSLPRDEFIAERDAAAKRLREAGEGDAAKRVKALRKPNLPAAAINRAVTADRAATDGLISAGERLEAAQSSVLAGEDAGALRDAAAEHGDAVERLMEAVVRELRGSGGSAAVDRARETLRAAAADPGLRAEIAGARLVTDREGVGFGAAVAGPAPSAETKRKVKAEPKSQRAKEPSAAQRKRAQQAVRRAERTLDAATKRAKEAKRRLDRAHRGLAEAEAEMADAERERDARQADLDDARAAAKR